jgi:hypothetical protein
MIDYKEILEKMIVIGYDGTNSEDEKIREALESMIVTLNEYNLSEEAHEVIFEILSKGGRDKLDKLPNIKENSWEDFNLGNVPIGSYVRVKKDAYDSEHGYPHNGLVGIMNRMYGGKASVNYIGLASGITMKHPIDKLESLKRGVQ